MSIAAILSVQTARKDQENCAICQDPILAGDSYKYWSVGFRGYKQTAHTLCQVPISLRASTETERALALAQEDLDSADPEDALSVSNALLSARDELEILRDLLKERVSVWSGTNLQYSTQYEKTEALIQELEDWLDRANDSLSGLARLVEHEEPDGLDPDDEKVVAAWEEDRERYERAVEEYEMESPEYQDAIDAAMGQVLDLPSA